MAQVQYYGTGRRKHSVARVRLVPVKDELSSINVILMSTSVWKHSN